jgi:hypothetical protein
MARDFGQESKGHKMEESVVLLVTASRLSDPVADRESTVQLLGPHVFRMMDIESFSTADADICVAGFRRLCEPREWPIVIRTDQMIRGWT